MPVGFPYGTSRVEYNILPEFRVVQRDCVIRPRSQAKVLKM
jgi:hypothetical protein